MVCIKVLASSSNHVLVKGASRPVRKLPVENPNSYRESHWDLFYVNQVD